MDLFSVHASKPGAYEFREVAFNSPFNKPQVAFSSSAACLPGQVEVVLANRLAVCHVGFETLAFNPS